MGNAAAEFTSPWIPPLKKNVSCITMGWKLTVIREIFTSKTLTCAYKAFCSTVWFLNTNETSVAVLLFNLIKSISHKSQPRWENPTHTSGCSPFIKCECLLNVDKNIKTQYQDSAKQSKVLHQKEKEQKNRVSSARVQKGREDWGLGRGVVEQKRGGGGQEASILELWTEEELAAEAKAIKEVQSKRNRRFADLGDRSRRWCNERDNREWLEPLSSFSYLLFRLEI